MDQKFFGGVPVNLTTTIFAGMTAIFWIQAVLCLILTYVSIFVRTEAKLQKVEKDDDETSSMEMQNTTTTLPKEVDMEEPSSQQASS
jgi:hypothetical protein